MFDQVKKILRQLIPPKTQGVPAPYELVRGPLTYNQDGLATIHNCDFMENEQFKKAYQLGRQTGSWGKLDIHWRAFVACWGANQVKGLDGDFVECGVNRGGLSLTVMEYIQFKSLQKKFYLLDTFCGLSENHLTEEEKQHGRKAGGYEECFEEVKRTFRDYKNVILIQGKVPETLSQVTSSKIAYLSIDMNCLVPEIEAIRYFWDKLVRGAFVLLDDYAWVDCFLQKKAFDEFAKEKKIQILPLPTGQGLLFKN